MTVCFALLGSLLLTLTLVPARRDYSSARGKHRQNPRCVMDWLNARYAAVRGADGPPRPDHRGGGRRPGRRRAVGLGTRLGTEFLPQLDEGVIWIRANLPPGISLAKSAAVAATDASR